MSLFFEKAKLSAIAAIVVYLTVFFLYAISEQFEVYSNSINTVLLFLCCLIPSTAIELGLELLIGLEYEGGGLTFGSLFTRDETYGFSIGDVMMGMLLSSLIFTILICYIELLYSDLSKRNKWYYPFQFIYNYITKKRWKSYSGLSVANGQPGGNKSTIKIKNLCKIYRRKKKIIDNLSMEFHDNQISVILAENNDGKSSLLHLICGLATPFSGTIELLGNNTDNFDASSVIGVSLQQDVLVGDLTVLEYLEFFSRLKGTNQIIARRESHQFIDTLGLSANILCKNLNNKMKKILSVAIAFSGDPKIVLLDEPTHGLELNEARKIWDFIKTQREGRTIVIASSSAFEAENIGDHLVLLRNGKLKHESSPDELRKKLGIGYELKCFKNASCQPKIFTEFVQKQFPNATMQYEDEYLITFLIGDSLLAKFSAAFKILESKLRDFGIDKFHVEHISLNEILLKSEIDGNIDITYNRALSSDYFHDNSENITIIENNETGKSSNLKNSKVTFFIWSKCQFRTF
jgi:ATP-binding cassette subfamily A (ABC1) protein 3